MLSYFTYVRLFAALWNVAPRVLCPWDSPGKNTGVGHYALLPGIEPPCVTSPLLTGGFITASITWEALVAWSP